MVVPHLLGRRLLVSGVVVAEKQKSRRFLGGFGKDPGWWAIVGR